MYIDYDESFDEPKPELSASFNIHNPEVEYVHAITTGNVVVSLGKFPVTATLFFKDEAHFVRHLIDLCLASGIEEFTFERPFSDYYVADVQFQGQLITPSVYSTEGFTALPLS